MEEEEQVKGTPENEIPAQVQQLFNPTEAILASMQLLPFPSCPTASLAHKKYVSIIQRSLTLGLNVFLIYSTKSSFNWLLIVYFQISIYVLMEIGHDELSQIPYNQQLTRLKSKSQIHLNSENSTHLTTRSVRNNEDDLRSLQRQLQNFPSLNELKSSPLTSWAPLTNVSSAKVNETRASIRSEGPSTRHKNLDDICLLPSNADQEKTDDTEIFALNVLKILKVYIILI